MDIDYEQETSLTVESVAASSSTVADVTATSHSYANLSNYYQVFDYDFDSNLACVASTGSTYTCTVNQSHSLANQDTKWDSDSEDDNSSEDNNIRNEEDSDINQDEDLVIEQNRIQELKSQATVRKSATDTKQFLGRNGLDNNYFKSLRWSPDGNFLLTSSNDNMMRLFPTPYGVTETSEELDLPATKSFKEGESIYDFAWYPLMNSQDPATCCFAASSRDHTVHLWDAVSGGIRCTYASFDHLDEVIAPTSLCFSPDGSKLYCGFNNFIQIFDTTRPGRDHLKRVNTTPTRRSKEGQKGIISCITFNPDGSGIYAISSYTSQIGLYDSRNDELLLHFTRKNHHPNSSATFLKFTPDGNYLISSNRQDEFIYGFDIRNTAEVCWKIKRGGKSNMRMSLDIDSSGRWLVYGSVDGKIGVTDLLETGISRDGTVEVKGSKWFDGHCDLVSSVGFHPGGWNLLASCSGSRKFMLECDSESASEINVDNSVKIWKAAGEWSWFAYQSEVESQTVAVSQ